jgi:hypothetical protein
MDEKETGLNERELEEILKNGEKERKELIEGDRDSDRVFLRL